MKNEFDYDLTNMITMSATKRWIPTTTKRWLNKVLIIGRLRANRVVKALLVVILCGKDNLVLMAISFVASKATRRKSAHLDSRDPIAIFNKDLGQLLWMGILFKALLNLPSLIHQDLPFATTVAII